MVNMRVICSYLAVVDAVVVVDVAVVLRGGGGDVPSSSGVDGLLLTVPPS